jgi:hypothetical protein
VTPLQEALSRARCWAAWHLGGLRFSGDFLECGRQLVRIYVELCRQYTSLGTAREALERAWGLPGSLPVTVEQVLEYWQLAGGLNATTLPGLSSQVAALYLLCVEGRLPREQALDLAELWGARAVLWAGTFRITPEGES